MLFNQQKNNIRIIIHCNGLKSALLLNNTFWNKNVYRQICSFFIFLKYFEQSLYIISEFHIKETNIIDPKFFTIKCYIILHLRQFKTVFSSLFPFTVPVPFCWQWHQLCKHIFTQIPSGIITDSEDLGFCCYILSSSNDVLPGCISKCCFSASCL